MGERFAVYTTQGMDLSNSEECNKMEFSAPEFHKLMAVINGFTMPVDQNWKLSLVVYGKQPPLRLYFNYNIEEQEPDIVIHEVIGKMRARHTLPKLAIGGPYPIQHLLEWAQHTLHNVQEYIQ